MARQKKKDIEENAVVNESAVEETVVDVDSADFDFGEKKVDKLKLSKNIIKYSLAAIFFALFIINGVLMQLEVQYEQNPLTAFVYAEKIPVIVQILLMLGCLFTVSVVANFFGGPKEKEYHVKEDTKVKK